jgi:lipoprotein-anchoring transpeptidase ErfK/SrfK
MKRWIGFLGSWALFVLAFGLTAFAAAGQWINMRDAKRLDRVALVDRMLSERGDSTAGHLRETAQQRQVEVERMKSKVQSVAQQTADLPDSGQTIIVSTAENRVYVRRGGQTIFEAICSTGKGTRMAIDGRTMVFETPIGKFHIKAKEENPQWVPPDWHYVEQARKNGMRVVRLGPGDAIDAQTGRPVSKQNEGVWGWFGGNNGSASVMRVRGNNVVVDEGGAERVLEPGKLIVAGDALVIPPVDTPQRHFDKVLGRYRLNLGDGYALHGTQETDKLGQSVSHGCVRLGDADLERLYQMANVGDEVVIY